jgi:hypothetical protein
MKTNAFLVQARKGMNGWVLDPAEFVPIQVTLGKTLKYHRRVFHRLDCHKYTHYSEGVSGWRILVPL